MSAKRMLIHALALTSLNLLVFFFIFRSFFFADDFYFQWLMRSSDLTELLKKVADLSLHDFLRPIPLLFSGISSSIFQLNPFAYNMINYILTTINAFLVFALALVTTKNNRTALLASILFLVFPAHWEAVGWPATLNTLLMTSFFLISTMTFVRYDEDGGGLYLFLSLFFFAIGLFTYEATIMLPIILIIYLALKQEKTRSPGVFMRLWPWLIVSFGYLILYFAKAYFFKANFDSRYQLGPHFIMNELNYLSTLILPFLTSYKLSSVLPQAVLMSINTGKTLLMILLPFLMGFLLLRTDRVYRFFLIWPLVTIFPFTFFTMLPVSRYMYLPSVGYVILLAMFLINVYEKTGSIKMKWLVAVFTCLMLLTYLATMIGYQKLFFYKKEIRRSILSDLKQIMPGIKSGGALYFTGLPIREDEITYMIYLWFDESYKINFMERESIKPTKRPSGSYFFIYDNGRLKLI